ncbi:MAG: hypothetical protein R3185_03140, partial [Candidatus Thermoplasmatota archaeon]|nr:hypothetical protein [Candidatus Thermoplasmatota archaeon]
IVVVDRDGQVVEEKEVDRGDHQPLEDWEVDSDEAMEIAREANQGLAQGTDREHYGLVLVLEQDDGRATWFIAGGGGDERGGGGGFAIIDARTGEVIRSGGGFNTR